MPKLKLVFLDAGSIGDDIAWPDFSALGEVVVHDQTLPGEIIPRVKDAEIVLTNKVPLTAEHIAAAPKLRYIGILATGYNQVDIKAAAARSIPVCNVPAYATPSVVQQVFTLLLALTSDICGLDASVRRGDWARSRHFCYWLRPLVELQGKNMGIVGFGDIGSRVAQAAHAFGMNVLAYDPFPRPAPDFSPFAFAGLEELFAESDAVSLHCPLTPENTGMVNAALLRTMKKNAFIINTARGPLINETDLRHALDSGLIAGAGLDVVTDEPMPDSNPLRRNPKCIITPHVAWATVESRTRLMLGVFDNVKNFLDGKPSNVRNNV